MFVMSNILTFTKAALAGWLALGHLCVCLSGYVRLHL